MSSPLAGLRFSLAGPGKVGSSLARWATAAGAELVAVAGRGALESLETEGQDLLLLALPEAALPAAAAALARRPQAAVASSYAGGPGFINTSCRSSSPGKFSVSQRITPRSASVFTTMPSLPT